MAILDTPKRYLRVGRACGQVKCVTGCRNHSALVFIMNRVAVSRLISSPQWRDILAAGMLCRMSMHGVHDRQLLRLAANAAGAPTPMIPES
jgi:hypothetical protein